MRIAYLINQYPKVSHSFIRREILALERQGFDITRISIRGWDEDLVDDADLAERGKDPICAAKWLVCDRRRRSDLGHLTPHSVQSRSFAGRPHGLAG